MIIHNPILPGFYPDPSVIRVGRDYYMATSSFEYFPAVPLFHSRDLLHWHQIGHALALTSQVDLTGRRSSQGIYAPTLRWHNGLFYMITTDVYGIGNFFVTAADPAGPWSNPVRIAYGNIDPSLMFDDDGKVYVTVQEGFGDLSHIIQYEIDPATGQALTEPAVIFHGDGGPWVEGAHLYKINGRYYLMAACGGTGREHREIIGRGESPYGPFERLPHPILTHKDLPEHPIQNIGHAELLEDTDGGWWAFFLGVRPTRGGYSVMGRETFLAPVHWTSDGWPMIDYNEGGAALQIETAHSGMWAMGVAPDSNKHRAASVVCRTEFHEEQLGLEWCYVRTLPKPGNLCFSKKPGWLALTGQADGLGSGGTPLFVCRRQQHWRMHAVTLAEFNPEAEGEEAGLAVRLSDASYYFIGIRGHEADRVVVAGGSKQGEDFLKGLRDPGDGPIWLSICSDEENYEFRFSMDGAEWHSMGSEAAAAIAPESEGAFTGVMVGMYAAAAAEDRQPPAAFFKFFEYTGLQD